MEIKNLCSFAILIFFYLFYLFNKNINEQPLITGISVTHDSQLIPSFTLAKLIKENFPESHITLGGATISILRDNLSKNHLLWKYYDSLVIGTGENALTFLYDALSNNSVPKNVPNLIWKQDSLININKRSDLSVEDISIPIFETKRKNPIIPIITSRGCDYARCNFCAYPSTYQNENKGYETISEERVLKMIKTLNQKHEPAYFHVTDTNVSSIRLNSISNALTNADMSPLLYSFTRFDSALENKDFCKNISQYFFALHLGMESASERVLKKMNKGISSNNLEKIINNLNDNGILVNLFLMGGIPTETDEDRKITTDFLRRNLKKITEISIAPFCLDLGSYISKNPQEFNLTIDSVQSGDLRRDLNYYEHGKVYQENSDIVFSMYKQIGIPPSYGNMYLNKLIKYFKK